MWAKLDPTINTVQLLTSCDLVFSCHPLHPPVHTCLLFHTYTKYRSLCLCIPKTTSTRPAQDPNVGGNVNIIVPASSHGIVRVSLSSSPSRSRSRLLSPSCCVHLNLVGSALRQYHYILSALPYGYVFVADRILRRPPVTNYHYFTSTSTTTLLLNPHPPTQQFDHQDHHNLASFSPWT